MEKEHQMDAAALENKVKTLTRIVMRMEVTVEQMQSRINALESDVLGLQMEAS